MVIRLGHVFQFRVELLGVEPPIWRRIQVPSHYSVWDLHVAIQDAMGWEDRHLHMFRFVGSDAKCGLPDIHGLGAGDTIPGNEVALDMVFSPGRPVGTYEYDFGDSWVHLVVFEGYQPVAAGAQYPACLDGARQCPPENSGGPHMYSDALRARKSQGSDDGDMLDAWLDPDFDPEKFSASEFRFSDPKARWERVIR